MVGAQVEDFDGGEPMDLRRQRAPDAEGDEGKSRQVREPREGGEQRINRECRGQRRCRGVAGDAEAGDSSFEARNRERRRKWKIAEVRGVVEGREGRRKFEDALDAEEGLDLGWGEVLCGDFLGGLGREEDDEEDDERGCRL